MFLSLFLSLSLPPPFLSPSQSNDTKHLQVRLHIFLTFDFYNMVKLLRNSLILLGLAFKLCWWFRTTERPWSVFSPSAPVPCESRGTGSSFASGSPRDCPCKSFGWLAPRPQECSSYTRDLLSFTSADLCVYFMARQSMF